MGRNKKRYQRSLEEQITQALKAMLKNGEGKSKKKVIEEKGTTDGYIFAYKTYHSYLEHCVYFAKWIKNRHPECTTLKKAQKYVTDWLKERQNSVNRKGEKFSAYTISLEKQALCKLYEIHSDQLRFDCPQRKRADIKRSRVPAVRDKHFSKTNNAEFIAFCQGTGPRRSAIEKLRGKDLYSFEQIHSIWLSLKDKDDKKLSQEEKTQKAISEDVVKLFSDVDYFIYYKSDKGGRDRYAPIISDDYEEQIVDRMRQSGKEELIDSDDKNKGKVWLNVPANADIHGYRSDYSNTVYKRYARPIEEVPREERYICRKDMRGVILDKVAMIKASKALGHNRLEIIANNYLRNL